MLIRLLERADPDERRRVIDVFSLPRRERTAAHVRWVRARMDAHGCIDYGRQVASGLAGAALAEFAAAFGHLPPSRDKDFIEELVTWVIERT
jgi:geranylgeranyl pyrophosphate synthase